jgi:hypothetical protein
MVNKIIKERRRSMNATPIRPSNKNQWQGAQADPKQKPGCFFTLFLKNNVDGNGTRKTTSFLKLG